MNYTFFSVYIPNSSDKTGDDTEHDPYAEMFTSLIVQIKLEHKKDYFKLQAASLHP